MSAHGEKGPLKVEAIEEVKDKARLGRTYAVWA
jgi:hypothetical protein